MQKEAILSRIDYHNYYERHLPSLKKNGKAEALALCPFHPDTRPSLSINLESGLFHCWSCNAGGDVFRFHQEVRKVGFKEALTEMGEMVGADTSPTNGPGKVVAVYKYKDLDENVLYTKERVEPGRNGKAKEFFFKHLKNGALTLGRGRNPILYNQPSLAPSKYILVTEGEAKADALKEWGLTATCLDAGSQSPWHDHYLPYFEGKKKNNPPT